MELVIKHQDQTLPIEWNYDEVKAWALDTTAKYKGMIVTTDDIGIAKEKRADLNKLSKMLDDARKTKKKEFMQPFEQFEKEIKDVVGIVNEASSAIDVQLKAFEDQRKADKLLEIKKLFDEFDAEYGMPADWIELDTIMKSQWLNATFSMNKIKAEIEETLAKIENDLQVIRALPEYAFEAEDKYSTALDLAAAMREAQRLHDMAQRKAEIAAQQEQRKAEAAARQLEQVAATADTTAFEKPAQGKWIAFEAFLTAGQAIALKEFFEAREIEFRPFK